MPVFNNIDFTKSCIDSLYSVGKKSKYQYDWEIIVVDNNSNDGTRVFLEQCRNKFNNFKYEINELNFGFAKACNIGASVAMSENLIFLNNDTVVLNGWDHYLLDTLKKNIDVWVVGSKCLYADDTIQHAGVVFDNDKLPFHVYRNFYKDFPPANIEIECKCVTAACMIIKKENFIKLGGFDEIYINGMEDVDLCLKVDRIGKKIIYQPKSVIKHYESKTQGRTTNIQQNRKIFGERWNLYIIPDALIHYEKTKLISVNGVGKEVLHILKNYPDYHISIEISPKLKMNGFVYEEIIKKEEEIKKREDEIKKIYDSYVWKVVSRVRDVISIIR